MLISVLAGAQPQSPPQRNTPKRQNANQACCELTGTISPVI